MQAPARRAHTLPDALPPTRSWRCAEGEGRAGSLPGPWRPGPAQGWRGLHAAARKRLLETIPKPRCPEDGQRDVPGRMEPRSVGWGRAEQEGGLPAAHRERAVNVAPGERQAPQEWQRFSPGRAELGPQRALSGEGRRGPGLGDSSASGEFLFLL